MYREHRTYIYRPTDIRRADHKTVLTVDWLVAALNAQAANAFKCILTLPVAGTMSGEENMSEITHI